MTMDHDAEQSLIMRALKTHAAELEARLAAERRAREAAEVALRVVADEVGIAPGEPATAEAILGALSRRGVGVGAVGVAREGR